MVSESTEVLVCDEALHSPSLPVHECLSMLISFCEPTLRLAARFILLLEIVLLVVKVVNEDANDRCYPSLKTLDVGELSLAFSFFSKCLQRKLSLPRDVLGRPSP